MTIKERIILASKDLFFKHGVRNVTMNDIATHLGISKRTIYENVKDKDELLEECIEHFERINDMELHKISCNENVKMIDVLKQLVDQGLEAIKNGVGNFIMEVHKYHPNVYLNTIVKYRKKRIARTLGFIRKGMDEGFFIETLDAETMALVLSNLFISSESNDLTGIQKSQIPVVFKTILMVICRGMATPEGIKEIDEFFKV